MVTPGTAPGTIRTRWFQDNSVGSCGLTSIGPEAQEGVCELTFKVVSGSALGVRPAAQAAPCPSGMVSIKQADGSSSCVMCGPGFYAASGACK
jgi:hypothetical protein